MNSSLRRRALTSSLFACLSIAACAARADVTISQQTSLDVASMIHTHGSTTTAYTADKKRQDTQTHCEGVMSIVCGNVQGGEIVRLDRGLTWRLEPTKKHYREQLFATPEQMAAMRAQLNAQLEKMRSCPASQREQPVDKSKCEMSPPKFDVRKTGETATIAGHDAQRTLSTITETCTNKETGDVCDTVVAIDVWLTQDALPGASDRRTFELAYAKKIGLDDPEGLLSGQMAQYLARYQAQLTELSEKAKQFKGQPLKTSFRVLMGGPQCSAAKNNTQGAGSESSAPNQAVTDVANAGKALGHFVGGMFKKKQSDDSAASSGQGANAPAGPATAAQDFPQMSQLIAFTTETMSIKTEAVPDGTFEVPADWTKEVPREAKNTKDEYTCPKAGG